ncbi:hypothetical protein QUB00_30295 [Microcoleus sp. F8_C2]
MPSEANERSLTTGSKNASSRIWGAFKWRQRYDRFMPRLQATGRFLQAHSTSDRPPEIPHPNSCPKRVSPNISLVMEEFFDSIT